MSEQEPVAVRIFLGPPIPIEELLRQAREEEAQEQQRDPAHKHEDGE